MPAEHRAPRASVPPSLPISESTIRAYLTTNIHYILDEECMKA